LKEEQKRGRILKLMIIKTLNDVKTEEDLLQLLMNYDLTKIRDNAKRDDLLEFLALKSIEKARYDFYAYVKLMAPEIIVEGFKDGAHIRLICHELQQLEQALWNPESTEHSRRLQIFLPPGAMKSLLCSRLFPSWCLGRRPYMRFIHVGHGTQFAEDNFGRPLRSLVETDMYKKVFPNVSLKSDVRAAGRWETDQGGEYKAVGAGGALAGRRGHLSICDDVVSEQSAQSKVELAGITNWYEPGLRTRLLPNSAELIINTRWAVNDLSGTRIDIDSKTSRPWRVVSIPALLDKESADLLRKYSPLTEGRAKEAYKVGCSFWPEFQPTDWLLEKRQTLLPSSWSALYMQNPVPEGGNIIKKDWFKLWDGDEPPDLDYVLITMDTAFSTKESADYSAWTVWGIFKRMETTFDGKEHMNSNMILLHAGKERLEFPDLCKLATKLNKDYSPDAFVIEKKASGQSLLQELRRRQIAVLEYLPDRDKMSRVNASAPFFYSGRVWVPKRNFSYALMDEICAFPKAPHDDLVDATTMAVLFMRDNWKIEGEDYPYYDEDEEYRKNKKRSYWSNSLKGVV
jgi:predicted phage terminase large subunit-like protein